MKNHKHNLVSFRIKLVLFLLLGSGVVTILRLIDVQLLKGADFQEMANANRRFNQQLPRERGLILDRFGNTLVVNQPLYYQALQPDQLYSEKQLIDRETALQLMASNSALVTMELRREYLLGKAGAHILGYTGPVSADDLKNDRNLTTVDLIGKQGLERIFDTILRGNAATEVYEVDAMGRKKRLLETQPGQPGRSIQTSLDPFLSTVALEAMGARTGSVVILDSDTGEVLTMVNSPTFDPNLLSARIPDEAAERARQQAVQEAFTHPKQLFFNRAISGAYPPGSVFKLVTAAAGLHTDAVDASTTVIDEGVLKVGEYSYANWYFTQYGRVEGEIGLRKALARSNDIYFYKAAEWIGPNALAEMARNFGFGLQTGIELQGEVTGTVPDPVWKEETLGERWFLGNTYHYGIGQGNLLVTPLQVAQMTQAIAHHGSLCQPHVVKKPQPECTSLAISDDDLSLVVSGMIDACSPGGTAYPLFSWNEERLSADLQPYELVNRGVIACKTGTAEFGVTDEQGYKNTHGWFTMFVGLNDVLPDEVPASSASADLAEDSEATNSATIVDTTDDTSTTQSSARFTNHQQWLENSKENSFPTNIVIAVLVESDEAEPYKEGSSDAAPVAKAILEWMSTGVRPTDTTEEVVSVPDNALAE